MILYHIVHHHINENDCSYVQMFLRGQLFIKAACWGPFYWESWIGLSSLCAMTLHFSLCVSFRLQSSCNYWLSSVKWASSRAPLKRFCSYTTTTGREHWRNSWRMSPEHSANIETFLCTQHLHTVILNRIRRKVHCTIVLLHC